MPTSLKVLLPALVASVTLAACGSSSGGSSSSAAQSSSQAAAATTPAASAVVVKSATNPTLHATVLVNSQGMTLYALSGEQSGKFICTSSACVAAWHPLPATSGTPAGSVGSLGTVTRPDGTVQVTYKGMPLYTFVQDQSAGEAKGQGLKDVGTWSAVTVSSSAPASSAAESGTETSAGTTAKKSSYGY